MNLKGLKMVCESFVQKIGWNGLNRSSHEKSLLMGRVRDLRGIVGAEE